MTEVYLGKPPAYIEAWMKNNFKTEKWVPAVYTDKWLFSDGSTYQLEYLDIMQNPSDTDRTVLWVFNGSDFTDNHDENAIEIDLSNYVSRELTAYRIYTPGHWEDGEGNWINGSWDSETQMTKLFGDGVTSNDYCSWVEAGSMGPQGTVSESGWYVGGGYRPSSGIGDKNSAFVYDLNWTISSEKTAGWRRVWTNTVPEK